MVKVESYQELSEHNLLCKFLEVGDEGKLGNVVCNERNKVSVVYSYLVYLL